MRSFLLVLLSGLAGCGASPAPQFFGAERDDVDIDGYHFAVYHRDSQAEVIRLGYLTRDRRDKVPALMIVAAEQATGCKVAGPLTGLGRSPSLHGDTGEARFRLNCVPATTRGRRAG